MRRPYRRSASLNRMKQTARTKSGFTLIELLVVIAIIAILAAMLGTRVLDTLSVPTPVLDAALHQTLLFLAGLAILAAGIAALRPGWATDAASRDVTAAPFSVLE